MRYFILFFLIGCFQPSENHNKYCGDSLKNNLEECDDGNKDNNDSCTEHCLTPFCGDGFENNKEECDYDNSKCNDDIGICYSCIECVITVEVK